jgi:hypothetical protein
MRFKKVNKNKSLRLLLDAFKVQEIVSVTAVSHVVMPGAHA